MTSRLLSLSPLIAVAILCDLFTRNMTTAMTAITAINEWRTAVYLLGIALLALTLYWSLLVGGRLPKLGQMLLASAAGVGFAWAGLANYLLFQNFGEYVTPHMLRFVVNDPRYLADYLITYRGPFLLATFLGVGTVGLWSFYRMARTKASSARSFWAQTLFIPLVVMAGVNELRVHARGAVVDAHTAVMLALQKYYRQDWRSKSLRNSPRTLLAGVQGNANDVILFIHETWDRKAWTSRGVPRDSMPELRRQLIKHPEEYFFFAKAYANSSATDVSLPSLVAGVAPHESYAKLHSLPLLWDWAKAAGFRTLFVTSQRLNWNGVDAFLDSPGLDTYIDGRFIAGPVVNDMGKDDLLAAEVFCREITAINPKTRVFAVFFSNAGHVPFQQQSQALQVQPNFPDSYDNALYLVDAAAQRIRNCLRQTGRADHTVTMMTGDHGHGTGAHGIGRLYSYYRDVIGVPFLIHVPRAVQKRHPKWVQALAKNRNDNVSNIDIAPSIADLTGALQSPENVDVAASLGGHSLLRALPKGRVIIAVNTNDIKKIDHEGFGLVVDDWHFVFSDIQGARLYNLQDDPQQIKDLWPTASPRLAAKFTKLIQDNFHLRRVYELNQD